jgi:hypothetical protein
MSPNLPSDNRALLVLSLKSNSPHAEGGKALAAGLKGNQMITELNISNNDLGSNSSYGPDISGIAAIADAIPDMGAMTKLDISSNYLEAEGGKALAAGLKGNQVITELNISSNDLARWANMSGVIALADVIPDMGAISSVNLIKNRIGSDQAEALVSMHKEHPTPKSLCGNRGDETELDMSGKMDGAGDAVMLAAEVIDNGALLTLIFGGDKVNSWDDAAPEPATLEVGMTEADFSSKNLGPAGAIIISAWISHKDKGALTSLNISSNNIGAYWGGQQWIATPEGIFVCSQPPPLFLILYFT